MTDVGHALAALLARAPRDAQVWVLIHVYGLTLVEVAEVFGVSRNRVWQRERRATRRLQAALVDSGAPVLLDRRRGRAVRTRLAAGDARARA